LLCPYPKNARKMHFRHHSSLLLVARIPAAILLLQLLSQSGRDPELQLSICPNYHAVQGACVSSNGEVASCTACAALVEPWHLTVKLLLLVVPERMAALASAGALCRTERCLPAASGSPATLECPRITSSTGRTAATTAQYGHIPVISAFLPTWSLTLSRPRRSHDVSVAEL
jgi:hypothetical protein